MAAAPCVYGTVFIDGERVADDTLDAIIRDNGLSEKEAAGLRAGACLEGGGGAAPAWRIVPSIENPAFDD